MKEVNNQSALERYRNIISAIANTAITETDGASKELGLIKYKFGLSTLKDRNIHVYFNQERVVIDMFINIDYGYRAPDVVCAIQELVKREVEKSTKFIVETINVNVANINFN